MLEIRCENQRLRNSPTIERVGGVVVLHRSSRTKPIRYNCRSMNHLYKPRTQQWVTSLDLTSRSVCCAECCDNKCARVVVTCLSLSPAAGRCARRTNGGPGSISLPSGGQRKAQLSCVIIRGRAWAVNSAGLDTLVQLAENWPTFLVTVNCDRKISGSHWDHR